MFLLGGTIKEEILPTHLEYWQNTDTEKMTGTVTANIGWYVVPILHDQPSYNIDIT